MNTESKDLFTTNWEELLQEGETATRQEGNDSFEVILLAGLQRLAREAGIIRQAVIIATPSPTMVQAVFTSVFATGRGNVEFVGTADCSKNNTSGKFANYPTAVAESRAEARSLRKALGITMLSSEEVGFREGTNALEASPGGKIVGSIVAAIEKLCEDRGVEQVDAMNAVLETSRASSIFELSELRTDEGQAMMTWLNDQKSAKKSKRSTRKAELQAKQGE